MTNVMYQKEPTLLKFDNTIQLFLKVQSRYCNEQVGFFLCFYSWFLQNNICFSFMCYPSINRISNLMRAITKNDKIITVKENPHSLEQSLAPIWKLTYHGGMLLDWCRPIPRRWFSTVIRYVFVALALTIAFYQLFSLTVQLFWMSCTRGM